MILLLFELVFILCGLHILHSDPTYLPISLHLPSALVLLPIQVKTKRKAKTKQKQRNEKNEKRGILSWKLLCGRLRHTVYPFVCSSLLTSVHRHEAVLMGLAQGLGFCCTSTVGSCWHCSWLSCFCFVSWRSCCFGSRGSSPSRAPTVHRGSKCRGGPTLGPTSGPRQ